MGCNKNLTDDQLEAMFIATDEEMQQTEQPMECLIERTKHKCKICTRFFSNKTVHCAQGAPVWTSNRKKEMPSLQ